MRNWGSTIEGAVAVTRYRATVLGPYPVNDAKGRSHQGKESVQGTWSKYELKVTSVILGGFGVLVMKGWKLSGFEKVLQVVRRAVKVDVLIKYTSA